MIVVNAKFGIAQKEFLYCIQIFTQKQTSNISLKD